MGVAVAPLRCPLCHVPLAVHERGARCSGGHTFDRARTGYLNLLPVQHKHSRHPGDDPAMVDARSEFLASGAYAPLRDTPGLFAQVRVGEFGTDIVWNDDLDMSADSLWRLAQEQAGLIMSPDAFRHWRERKAYTLDGAAQALGLSRRMVAYYEQGEKPIPRVVALAARALELV